ncbi:MAG: hypothetical protein HQL30_06105 [Candidatus Omnitrophica bacterium]|nr:hypothetical protein [Candidatus Omnitrophota bacterium]
MKYKTIIEIVCDAADRDEASNIAGEYLRGLGDTGISMRCKTVSMRTSQVVKYGSSLIGILLFLSALSLNSGQNVKEKGCISSGTGMPTVCTVIPELKTIQGDTFKKEWKEKKDRAILEYIKN